jgi:hypothetical protein
MMKFNMLLNGNGFDLILLRCIIKTLLFMIFLGIAEMIYEHYHANNKSNK